MTSVSDRHICKGREWGWFLLEALKENVFYRASLVVQRLKRLPAMWETWVQSLGQEDPLEKEMVTHSSILAWRIPRTGEPGGPLSIGLHRVGHN